MSVKPFDIVPDDFFVPSTSQSVMRKSATEISKLCAEQINEVIAINREEHQGVTKLLSEAVSVIKFCRNANPHPDLSFHKYNDAYRWIEEETQEFLDSYNKKV